MLCPGCREWVSSPKENCPKCGFELSVLRSLEDLRTAIRTTRNVSDTFARRLRDLEEQVNSLEPVLVSKLATPETKPAEYADEDKLELLEPATSGAAPNETPGSPGTTQTPQPPWATPQAPESPGSSRDEIEVRLGQRWLLVAGVVITVLAIGYFLKYSFDRNWIGPAGRVSMAFVAGIVLLSVGEVCRRKRFELFGLYLIGGGIAVLYFASYASFQIYNLISQPVAFGVMVLVTVLAGLLAVFYDTKGLAVLGMIGGFLAPVVLSTGTDNQIALMTYMAILNGGILAIAAFRQWGILNSFGLIFTWLLFTAWYVRHYEVAKFRPTTVFLNLFFLSYAFAPFAYYFVRKTRKQMTGFSITIPNTFVAFAYSFATIREQFSLQAISIVTVAYAAIFLGMASYLYRRNRENLDAFILLLAKGLLFLIITVPVLFSEHWITVFWSAQAIVLLWAALKLGSERLLYGAAALLLIATLKLVFHDYTAVFGLRALDLSYRDGFSNLLLERSMTVAVALATLFAAGRMLKAAALKRPEWRENLPAAFFYALFGVVLFLAFNVETAGYFHDAAPRARFASISVLWALFATVLMVLGFARNLSMLRRCSIALFAATILKVFLRDMAAVDTPYRILSFLVLGLMLVGASYLYHRFKAHILPAADKKDTET